MRWPSGEICGSDAVCRLKMSSAFSPGRFCWAVAVAAAAVTNATKNQTRNFEENIALPPKSFRSRRCESPETGVFLFELENAQHCTAVVVNLTHYSASADEGMQEQCLFPRPRR